MAKIPQGEWKAIAARYAKGESISKIAQSYSCEHFRSTNARERV